MKRKTLNIMIVIAAILIPIIFFFEINFELNGLLVLFFGIYSFFVCVLHFIRANRFWKSNDLRWKNEFGRSYLIASLWVLAMAFLISLIFYIPMLEFVNPYELFIFLFASLFLLLALLFPIGLILLIIGIMSLKYRSERPRFYLGAIFFTAISFILSGVLPALVLLLGEGFVEMCYCPVNKRSFKRDFLLKPLYDYRKKQLRSKLDI